MAILRIDIERALDELVSQEEGMRFQGLAVVLGKKRWPELVARPRKKDLGLDAYAHPSLTQGRIGKGLAASITPKLKKISDDLRSAKENFPELKMLLFVTPAKVGIADQEQWKSAIQKDCGLELHILEREEIIAEMMMPENASLRASFLHIEIEAEPQIADLIARTRRAAETVTRNWADRTERGPLIDLTAVRIDSTGVESAELLSIGQIDQALSQSRRIVLEGPAGRGKTTMLIQLAQRERRTGIPFIVELPAWTSSRRGILEYIAGMPAFLAERLTAGDLARIQQTVPFLLLLNGWNEIAESNSEQASHALRELERDFASAGIIVATRAHHLTPPLPGAFRLRLLRLRRAQRAAYLAIRLGAKDVKLRGRIDADPLLDEVTRTPFILSEVVSLFEADAEIPSTKMGVLAQVLRLQEQRDEHRNSLQTAPVFGQHKDYLKALAIEMTRRGAAALSEAEARIVVATVARELANQGQIQPPGASEVLATLTAHHVLERVEYPHAAFQFEHQQLQEYYAALDVRTRLLDLRDDRDTIGRFTADFANDPAWAEPLRMIAATVAEQPSDDEINIRAGERLVEMALVVDLVFAGELARLCGAAVWSVIRRDVAARLRSAYAIRDDNFRQYALAAMIATGADDFNDIIVPLLSAQDQQVRLSTCRLWPDIQVTSLGTNWRKELRSWSDEARADFVSELLHHRADAEVAAFAVDDKSAEVKKAAALSFMWTRSDDALSSVLNSMDAQTFEEVACRNAGRMPAALRPKVIRAIRQFIEITTDHLARLRAVLELIELGESGLGSVVKDAMSQLSRDEIRNLSSRFIRPALEYLRQAAPDWMSEWVAAHVADGALNESWLPFATDKNSNLVEKYLKRLETEDLKNARIDGMIAVISACADEKRAARILARLCELRRKVDAEPGVDHGFEWPVMRQLEAVFRGFPDGIKAAGILSAAKSDELDINVATAVLSLVARQNLEPLHIADGALKARLREYLRSNMDLVLRQDDFNGEEKANLASSIAQAGKPEDIADLVTIIHADIERMRRSRIARAAGDRGPLVTSSMNYANWNIAAVLLLDAAGTEQVLIDLLSQPEYRTDAAEAMARDFVRTPENPFDPKLCYDLVWAAREGRVPSIDDDGRRARFASALSCEIGRLREQTQDGKVAWVLKELAKALAAVDPNGSAEAIFDVIAIPGEWDHHSRLDAAERLLIAGVSVPAYSVFALVDSFLERTEKWTQNSDDYLLHRILSLCPFVDDPAAGIAKMREVHGQRGLSGYEARDLIIALGESRSDAAVSLLCELASDASTFEKCEDDFFDAFAKLDTTHSREILMGFVDPDLNCIASPHGSHGLVVRLTELAQRRPAAAARLRELCGRDLPEFNREILSKVMGMLGTVEALAANLNLINDAKPTPVPRGIWEQLNNAFVERRPYEQDPNAFTVQARASNELRIRLFKMVTEDKTRWKSAFSLLGQIEEWRLEYGRPTGEYRHPDLASGQPWPPKEPGIPFPK